MNGGNSTFGFLLSIVPIRCVLVTQHNDHSVTRTLPCRVTIVNEWGQHYTRFHTWIVPIRCMLVVWGYKWGRFHLPYIIPTPHYCSGTAMAFGSVAQTTSLPHHCLHKRWNLTPSFFINLFIHRFQYLMEWGLRARSISAQFSSPFLIFAWV